MSKCIRLPERFDHESYVGVSASLMAARSYADVDVDFSALRYSFPLSMLVIGALLREFVAYRKERGLKTTAYGLDDAIQAQSYLQHLGFFHFIGLDIGKDIGQATGNTKYLPIRRITREQLTTRVDPPYRTLQTVIQEETDGLARVILHNVADAATRMAVSYSLREVVRNVFEHSGADECFLCAQRWWDGQVQVGIVDAGRGILASLSTTYPDLDSKGAIKSAILPGVSRIKEGATENKYDNSGYGLYVLAELGRECGWFSLGSGDHRVTASPADFEAVEPVRFPGTFVGLNLDSGVTMDFRSKLKDIIQSGEAEARMLGTNPTASRSSSEA